MHVEYGVKNIMNTIRFALGFFLAGWVAMILNVIAIILHRVSGSFAELALIITGDQK